MPLVFGSSEVTKSGLKYADRTGVSYEYPKQYQGRVVVGEPFIYYRSGSPAYTGVAVVGGPVPSDTAGRLACAVVDYQPFAAEVPLNDPETGEYLEPHPAEQPIYRNGVRTISDDGFARILELGGLAPSGKESPDPASPKPSYGRDPFVNAEVELFAVRTAVAILSGEQPPETIRVMARNNPGYDILVGPADNPLVYVEVKGTRRGVPAFFLTEGERAFSHAHDSSYHLLVVYEIDLSSGSFKLWRYDGAVDEDAFILSPTQWQVRPTSSEE